ncbi:hypothetical protein [Corynebacterium caspium]|uniref:hypothetical protein n=1 Tax=Corynebacterium caspium TaxID=234828 RepID=UPI00036C4BEB|nr:hypothetical protein [Corynebacterium caspium]WKD59931.1 hypothetical protein CCASP_07780 [Corynebacterium caspium DSM 44850]
MNSQMVMANQAAEYFPAYRASGMHYIAGYDPVSYSAPHSSLNKVRTWLGMGLVLAALCPAGIAIWGGAIAAYGNTGLANHTAMPFLAGGIISALLLVVVGTILIKSGRRDYHAYVRETGRVN